MIDALIAAAVVVVGIVGAFFYGSRRGEKKQIDRQDQSDKSTAERTKEKLDAKKSDGSRDRDPTERLSKAGRLRD